MAFGVDRSSEATQFELGKLILGIQFTFLGLTWASNFSSGLVDILL